ncbi:hypothetical protein HOY80DRAFT_1067209 [Tuber brumale]|nr:hypothetical protein HOY80DRAFT_1067209 [Tuber brumale]
MLEGGYVFELRGKNAKQLIGDLVEREGGWENDHVVIMKEGGEEKHVIGEKGGEKEVVNLVSEEEGGKEEMMEVEEEVMDGREDLEESANEKERKRFKEWKMEFRSVKEILEENVDGEVEEGLLESWKLESKVKKKRRKEEGLKREKEWEEEALGYSIDVTLRRLERLSMRLFDKMRSIGGAEEDERRKREEDREEKKKKREELSKMEVVEGGRSYKKVVNGVRFGVNGSEIMEMEEKKEKERKHEQERERRKEEKEVMSLEVVLDSQLEGESSWDRSKWEEELGLEKGRLREIKGYGNRVKVVVSGKKDLDKGREAGKEKWDSLVKGKMTEVRRLDKWCGVVVPGMELDIWEGNLKGFRENFEMENGVKLMKVPRWMVEPSKARRMKMKWAGVVDGE